MSFLDNFLEVCYNDIGRSEPSPRHGVGEAFFLALLQFTDGEKIVSRIYCIVGKSASGKDTVYREILAERPDSLIPIVPYTTRPQRVGERNGVDYHFVSFDELAAFEAAGRVIEKREYHTTQGLWVYFTLQFELEEGKDYILINTLEGAKSLTRHYGAETVSVVYLEADDKTRLLRYIERESRQATPDYAEVCRRFLADQKDFSEAHMREMGNLIVIDSSKSVAESVEAWRNLYHSHR